MNGIVILDKPFGKTSHDMVSFMRRLTGIKRIGHTGTLDPMATGVLPVCIGTATKAADMLTLSDKVYRAEFILGMTTDTLDAEGEVITECGVFLEKDEIVNAVNSFVGEIWQTPPMYSAIKQNGKKLYELARQGLETERKKRLVTINHINILDIDMEEYRVKIEVSCSKGTYIRTLCEDIGIKLGVGAYMNSLRRIKTGCFCECDASAPDKIRELYEKGEIPLICTDEMFSEYEAVFLNERQTRSIKNGVRMSYKGIEGECYRLYDNNGDFLCISEIRDGRLVLIKSFWQS